MPLNNDKKRKLRKVLGALDPNSKTDLIAQNLEEEIKAVGEKLSNIRDNSSTIQELQAGLDDLKINILSKLAQLPTQESLDGVKKKYLDGIEQLRKSFSQIVSNIEIDVLGLNSDLEGSKKDLEKELKSIKEIISKWRIEILNQIENKGGGSPNQQIKVNGTVATTQYADINIVASGATVENDNVNKNTKITLLSGGTPGGSDTQVQFNDGGSFGGSAYMTFDKTNGIMSLHKLRPDSSDGLLLESNNGTDIALFGAGGGGNATFYDGVKLNSQTASNLLALDSSKNITSIGTTLPVTYGGAGLSNARTDISTTGTINNLAVTTSWLYFTGANPTVTGLVAQADGTEVTLTTGLSTTLTLSNQNTNSTAANRIITQQSSSMVLPAGSTYKLRYDGNAQRWRITGGLPIATSGVNGYLSAGDFTTFNGKLDYTSGTDKGVAWFNGTNQVKSDNTLFNFNQGFGQLGLQILSSNTSAVVHAKSNISQTLATPASITATLTQFTFPTEPTSGSATNITANMGRTTGESATINYGSGSYTANGSTVDYEIYEGYDDGAGNITLSPYVSQTFNGGADDNSSNPYYISLTWTPNNGNYAANFFVIYRSINSGGFNEYTTTTNYGSFDDDNTAWSGGTYTPSNGFFPDFYNTGTLNFSAYGYKLSPISTAIYSTGHYDYSFTDPANGQPYLISHSGSGASDYIKITNGSNGYSITNTSFSFTQDTTTPFTESSAVAPTTYGYLSDGSTLNRTYEDYAYDGSTYSSGFVTSITTTDPNDSNYYYIAISPTLGGGTQAKIRRDINSGGYNDSRIVSSTATFYDDGVTTFGSNDAVTPNSFYASTGQFESHGSSSTDRATVVLKSLDGSYTRLEMQNSSGTRLAYIETSSTGMFSTNVLYETFVSIAAGSVPNNSVFKNSADGKLSFKDNSGTTHALY